jgi:hypothetical protein
MPAIAGGIFLLAGRQRGGGGRYRCPRLLQRVIVYSSLFSDTVEPSVTASGICSLYHEGNVIL